MRIAILTGGTGSIALQRGLYQRLEQRLDGIDIKIIVNAYDNGLSTGVVRQVMNGQILGPSDVRKNQTTRLQLRDPTDPWLRFLGCRFTATDAAAAYERCRDEVNRLTRELHGQDYQATCRRMLVGAIEEFFRSPAAAKVMYDDFALANIVYAGLAKANGNSLRAAASIMAEALNIPDNVLVNDDRSLFLGALTRTGRRITDEGEIVCWGKEDDPFVDLFFVDVDGKASTPQLCLESWQALVEADLIILSAGTQWSSLIPTYASRGFQAAIRDSAAKVLMVVNRMPDKDSPGQTASDIVNVLVPRFFEEGRLHVLMDSNGHSSMTHLQADAAARAASATSICLSTPADPPDKHNPTKLADAIGYVYFREYLGSDFFLFDYDDTLVGRGQSYPRSSQINVRGLTHLNSRAEVGICTGNTIRAVQLREEPIFASSTADHGRKSLLVFADGGANMYSYDILDSGKEGGRSPEISQCVCPEALLPQSGPHSAREIIDALRRAGVPGSNIFNRGGALVAIRPVEQHYRHAVMSLAHHLVEGSGLKVRFCGRSTVEIYKPTLSKRSAVKHLLEQRSDALTITYIGDECDSGNDLDIRNLASSGARIRCLQVSSPAMTAFFISTLIAHLDHYGSR